MPGLQDGAGLGDPVLDDEGPAVDQDDGERDAGSGDGVDEGGLTPGQVEVGAAGGLAGELAGLVEGEDDQVGPAGGVGDGGDLRPGDGERVLPAEDGELGRPPAAGGGLALQGAGQGVGESGGRRGGEALDPGAQVVGVSGGRSGQSGAMGRVPSLVRRTGAWAATARAAARCAGVGAVISASAST